MAVFTAGIHPYFTTLIVSQQYVHGSPSSEMNIIPSHISLSHYGIQSAVLLNFVKGGAHTLCMEALHNEASTQ